MTETLVNRNLNTGDASHETKTSTLASEYVRELGHYGATMAQEAHALRITGNVTAVTQTSVQPTEAFKPIKAFAHYEGDLSNNLD